MTDFEKLMIVHDLLIENPDATIMDYTKEYLKRTTAFNETVQKQYTGGVKIIRNERTPGDDNSDDGGRSKYYPARYTADIKRREDEAARRQLQFWTGDNPINGYGKKDAE